MTDDFIPELRDAHEGIREATDRRDALIVKASDAGMTRRAVSAAAGLSVGRIQQIIDARRAAKK